MQSIVLFAPKRGSSPITKLAAQRHCSADVWCDEKQHAVRLRSPDGQTIDANGRRGN